MMKGLAGMWQTRTHARAEQRRPAPRQPATLSPLRATRVAEPAVSGVMAGTPSFLPLDYHLPGLRGPGFFNSHPRRPSALIAPRQACDPCDWDDKAGVRRGDRLQTSGPRRPSSIQFRLGGMASGNDTDPKSVRAERRAVYLRRGRPLQFYSLNEPTDDQIHRLKSFVKINNHAHRSFDNKHGADRWTETATKMGEMRQCVM